jgi:hypothetical protein
MIVDVPSQAEETLIAPQGAQQASLDEPKG